MKKTLLVIGLGTAFLAVSLWVWLSNGKSAKAVKAKFRLGGALLTLTGMMAIGGCKGSLVSCYDPAPQNVVYIEREVSRDTPQSVRNGDLINIEVSYFSAYGIKVTVEKGVYNREVLQSETYKITDSKATITHTINVGDHVGEAHLRVYIMHSEEEAYEYDHLFLNVLE